jgi:hypothetical protein
MNQIFFTGITLQELVEALTPLLTPQKSGQPQQTENDLLTRDEVCRLLSINKTTLWKHTRSGKLKSFGIGNRVFYSKCQVLDAIKPLNH